MRERWLLVAGTQQGDLAEAVAASGCLDDTSVADHFRPPGLNDVEALARFGPAHPSVAARISPTQARNPLRGAPGQLAPGMARVAPRRPCARRRPRPPAATPRRGTPRRRARHERALARPHRTERDPGAAERPAVRHLFERARPVADPRRETTQHGATISERPSAGSCGIVSVPGRLAPTRRPQAGPARPRVGPQIGDRVERHAGPASACRYEASSSSVGSTGRTTPSFDQDPAVPQTRHPSPPRDGRRLRLPGGRLTPSR